MPSSQERGMRYGPGDIVKEKYDAALAGVGNTLWRGAQQTLAASFGKGLVLGALFLVAAATVTFGFGAYGGFLTHGTSAASMVAPTMGEALTAGFNFGAHLLFSEVGAAAALAGGLIGMAIDQSKNKAKLSTAEAMKVAQTLAQARQSPQLSLEKMPEQAHDTPEKSFRAEEMDRRARAAGASQLRQGYGPK